jgi:hypothetical protein
MPVYAKKVSSKHGIFQNRNTIIAGGGEITVIPIPNDVTLCNGCNSNIEEGYLIYLGKRELDKNQPYDYYCEPCAKRYFKGMKVV